MPIHKRILLTGGGSGGHIMPNLAVAAELEVRVQLAGRVVSVLTRGKHDQRTAPVERHVGKLPAGQIELELLFDERPQRSAPKPQNPIQMKYWK